jgi:hypothetical protein
LYSMIEPESLVMDTYDLFASSAVQHRSSNA